MLCFMAKQAGVRRDLQTQSDAVHFLGILTCHLGAHGVREADVPQLQVASLGCLDGCIPGMGSVGFRSAVPGACVGPLPPRARWQRCSHRGVRIVRADCLAYSA